MPSRIRNLISGLFTQRQNRQQGQPNIPPQPIIAQEQANIEERQVAAQEQPIIPEAASQQPPPAPQNLDENEGGENNLPQNPPPLRRMMADYFPSAALADDEDEDNIPPPPELVRGIAGQPYPRTTPPREQDRDTNPLFTDLRRLAAFSESAMGALSPKDQKGIDLLSNRYAKTVATQGGVQRVLEETLKVYLKQNDNNIIENHKDLLNKHHIVYRYLFLNTNPKISPDAHYTVHNDRGEPIRGDIRDQDLELLAYICLAAEDIGKDTGFKLPEDYQKQMKEFIVAQLALIARAHNWDKTRVNTQGREEEYDDGEGDKPSCSSGVKRRLAQILDVLLMNVGPEYRTLSAPVIKKHYQEHVVTGDQPGSLFKKIDNFSTETLKKVSQGFLVFINQDLADSDDEMSEGEQEAALSSFKENLSVTDEDFQVYLEQLKAYFGPERITGQADPKPRGNDNTSYESYAKFAEYLRSETLTLFGDILNTKLNEAIQHKKPQEESSADSSPPSRRNTP